MKTILSLSCSLLCFFLFTSNAQSQDSYSLMGPLPDCGSFGSFVKTTTHIYSILSCRSNGTQLYVSDGSEPLRLVKEIIQETRGGSPGNMLPVGNKLYFTASSGSTQLNRELWVTDGTEAGTIMIRDICVGTCGSDPSSLTEMNGIVYFSAYSTNYGYELWRTDGTSNGTYPVADLQEGSNGGLHNNRDIHAHNNTLFFCARSSNNLFSDELYKTDGTEEGTVLVKEINTVLFTNSTATQSSLPQYFISLGDIVLFSANDGIHGVELWKTDGTEAGTVLVKDINPGLSNSNPFESDDYDDNYYLYNNEIYFSANDGVHGVELWKTDGTEAGTVMLKEANTSPTPQYSDGNPHRMTTYNGKLYYWAESLTQPNLIGGLQVWESDGTADGSFQLTSYSPPASSSPLVVCNDLLYMKISYNAIRILMRYDGETVDTVSNQTDQNKYLLSSENPVCFNDYLYTNADGLSVRSVYTFGTWKIDGVNPITTATVNPTAEDNTIYIISESELEIKTDDKISEVKIINTSGAEMPVTKLDDHTIDISNFSNGMYIVRTITDSKILTKKIILTK